jgi:hypothetical protein
MSNRQHASGNPQVANFLHRSERIDGPEVRRFAPTFQELTQIIKFHIRALLEMHFEAFTTGLGLFKVDEHAIWVRLDKIRKVMRETDFRIAVEIECIQFGMESDAILWEAFVYGDAELRRATKLEFQQSRLEPKREFSGQLLKRIDKVSCEQKLEVPPEILRRMAHPVLTWTEEESGLIQ